MRSVILLIILSTQLAHADGLGIDKVYHPYVQPLERELEWRMISADGEQHYRLGLGQSVSDKLFLEAYLIGEDDNKSDFDVSELELEAKWQLTEQGEYDYDWGLLTELEYDKDDYDWEFSSGILVERQWGKFVGTANLFLSYEWGHTVKDELESSLASQLRYRYSSSLEPAVELYVSQETRAFGPVVLGDIKLPGRKKLHWETGAIFGLDSKTPDSTIRLLTEFEF